MHWLDDEHRRYSIDIDEQEEAKCREEHRVTEKEKDVCNY